MQNNSLVSLFTETIHKDFHLKRDNRFWILEDEDNKEQLSFRAINSQCLAFSLDEVNIKKNPFPFFSENPPVDVSKICDAIIIMEYKQKTFILAVEKKSAHKNDCTKQLNNAKYFCDWLILLFQKYKHHSKKKELIFCKLLCWKPRKIPSKEPTIHYDTDYGCYKSKDKFFNCSCEVQNKSDISLLELAKTIKKDNIQ